MQLDIVCQNYISPENLKRPLYNTEIENAAFSHDGLWLLTLERRDDHETTPEIRLKFWAFHEEKQLLASLTKFIIITSGVECISGSKIR